jgi:hypothetical protein
MGAVRHGHLEFFCVRSEQAVLETYSGRCLSVRMLLTDDQDRFVAGVELPQLASR